MVCLTPIQEIHAGMQGFVIKIHGFLLLPDF